MEHKEEWLLLNLAFVRGKKPLLKLSKQLIKNNASVASYDFSFLKEVRKRHLTCNFVIGVIKVCNNAVFFAITFCTFHKYLEGNFSPKMDKPSMCTLVKKIRKMSNLRAKASKNFSVLHLL